MPCREPRGRRPRCSLPKQVIRAFKPCDPCLCRFEFSELIQNLCIADLIDTENLKIAWFAADEIVHYDILKHEPAGIWHLLFTTIYKVSFCLSRKVWRYGDKFLVMSRSVVLQNPKKCLPSAKSSGNRVQPMQEKKHRGWPIKHRPKHLKKSARPTACFLDVLVIHLVIALASPIDCLFDRWLFWARSPATDFYFLTCGFCAQHFPYGPATATLPLHSRPCPHALSQPCCLHLPTWLLSVQSPRSYTHTHTRFYTNQLFHNQLWLKRSFTPNTFCRNPLLHQPACTQTSFYTNSLFHKPPFTSTSSYTNELLHTPASRQSHFSTNQPLHKPTFCTNQPLQISFYTNQLLDKPPCTQITFYIPLGIWGVGWGSQNAEGHNGWRLLKSFGRYFQENKHIPICSIYLKPFLKSKSSVNLWTDILSKNKTIL